MNFYEGQKVYYKGINVGIVDSDFLDENQKAKVSIYVQKEDGTEGVIEVSAAFVTPVDKPIKQTIQDDGTYAVTITDKYTGKSSSVGVGVADVHFLDALDNDQIMPDRAFVTNVKNAYLWVKENRAKMSQKDFNELMPYTEYWQQENGKPFIHSNEKREKLRTELMPFFAALGEVLPEFLTDVSV